MSEEWGPWIEHDGRGCPCSGQFVESESRDGLVMKHIAHSHRSGSGPIVLDCWDWSQPLWRFVGRGEQVVRYRIRNPRTASTDTGMAMLKEILDRETIEPAKRKVTT